MPALQRRRTAFLDRHHVRRLLSASCVIATVALTACGSTTVESPEELAQAGSPLATRPASSSTTPPAGSMSEVPDFLKVETPCSETKATYGNTCGVSGNVRISTGWLHSNTQALYCPKDFNGVMGYWVKGPEDAAYTSGVSELSRWEGAVITYGRLVTMTDHSHTSGTHRQAFTPWLTCIRQYQ